MFLIVNLLYMTKPLIDVNLPYNYKYKLSD